ncbi:VrrA/YqfQ family protein [Gracilibacillus suaedae]|uniref:VrrA/YqfQ family protein n=1 Tax=Gracilibacillus suaedae TaxID=2820273 RepID=UPI001ABEAF84|nr:VrrA/YqfQ family protein [Gracilibacillus suaedae]
MFRPPNQPPMFPQQNIPTQGLFPRGPVPNQMTNPTGLQGILQRFLPSQASNMTQATNMAAGSGSNLMGTLNNVQQVLKVAQQATPLIKEYGPMIKNAPKLINMMKALNEINDDEDENEYTDDVEEVEEAQELTMTESTPSTQKQTKNNAPIRTSESQPKLFI